MTLMHQGHSVSVKLVHERSSPRDSRVLAFVCEITGEHHTIGYVVSKKRCIWPLILKLLCQ